MLLRDVTGVHGASAVQVLLKYFSVHERFFLYGSCFDSFSCFAGVFSACPTETSTCAGNVGNRFFGSITRTVYVQNSFEAMKFSFFSGSRTISICTTIVYIGILSSISIINRPAMRSRLLIIYIKCGHLVVITNTVRWVPTTFSTNRLEAPLIWQPIIFSFPTPVVAASISFPLFNKPLPAGFSPLDTLAPGLPHHRIIGGARVGPSGRAVLHDVNVGVLDLKPDSCRQKTNMS